MKDKTLTQVWIDTWTKVVTELDRNIATYNMLIKESGYATHEMMNGYIATVQYLEQQKAIAFKVMSILTEELKKQGQ